LVESEVSQPQLLRYPTRDGGQAYANFYPASEQVSGEKSALVVLVHGGPTSRSGVSLSPLIQYFAQNGFSVLDVNHRGSTGHGRDYRQALLGLWGEIDASDIADAIDFVIAEREVDAQKVFIRGGSAGGYAVLRALTRFPELFCGGACYYGIGNLITLSEITHKFEGRYTDQLIGEHYTPETAAAVDSRFRSRSPIFEIERISSPLILFQGLDDKVVPPEVSREMVQTLERNGVVHEYIEYQGEGHGFRKAETRIDALSREIQFYKDILNAMRPQHNLDDKEK
jgi:dipeptidyl aminopeptidase/acylaminoacyl peptidase